MNEVLKESKWLVRKELSLTKILSNKFQFIVGKVSEILLKLFCLLCNKRLTLYGPRPSSLATFSPASKCRTSTGYFQMPHTTKTSNMLFVFNSLMKSCHSDKKTFLRCDMERYLWQMLSCCGLTVFYYISVNFVHKLKLNKIVN